MPHITLFAGRQFAGNLFDGLEFSNGVPEVSPSNGSVNVSGTIQLTALHFTGGSVTWGSSDTGLATVNSSGLVTGVANGTVTITATGVTDPGETATANIVVGLDPSTVMLQWTIPDATLFVGGSGNVNLIARQAGG